jgi:hypothetical protein
MAFMTPDGISSFTVLRARMNAVRKTGKCKQRWVVGLLGTLVDHTTQGHGLATIWSAPLRCHKTSSREEMSLECAGRGTEGVPKVASRTLLSNESNET